MIKKLLYLGVICLGVAMAVPTTRARLLETAAPVTDSFRSRITVRRVSAMADQLTARVNRGEGLPGNFEGWLRREFTGTPEDAWGNPYYLQARRDGFVVGSTGPDGVHGTDDDIREQRRLR
jgi:hypothetical protein